MSVLKNRINKIKKRTCQNNKKLGELFTRLNFSDNNNHLSDIERNDIKNKMSDYEDDNRTLNNEVEFLNKCISVDNSFIDFMIPMDNIEKAILGKSYIKAYAHGKIEYVNKNNLKLIKTSEVFLNE